MRSRNFVGLNCNENLFSISVRNAFLDQKCKLHILCGGKTNTLLSQRDVHHKKASFCYVTPSNCDRKNFVYVLRTYCEKCNDYEYCMTHKIYVPKKFNWNVKQSRKCFFFLYVFAFGCLPKYYLWGPGHTSLSRLPALTTVSI